MSTEKRLGGEGAAPKGKFLRHLNFGYAKNISFKPVPSDEALDDMLRMNMSKDVIDGYCNGVELECMNCLIHGICMQNLNGGMEIYSDKYCESPVTYGKSGLIFINGRVESLQEKTDVVLFASAVEAFGLPTSCHGRAARRLSWANRPRGWTHSRPACC